MEEAHLEGARPKDRKSFQDGASVKSSKSAGSSSKRSSTSSVGAAAARARAKAEAARARVSFVQREISIKVDKARLEASLEALNLEKEAAAAIAQAEVLEAAADLENKEHRSWKSLPNVVQTHERVSDYIKDQSMQLNQRSEYVNMSLISEYPIENNPQPPTKDINKEEYIVKECWPPPFQPQQSSEAFNPSRTAHIRTTPAHLASEDDFPVQSEVQFREPKSNILRPNTKLAFPQYSDTSHTNLPESSVMMNMAKYLARKELVSTGLTHFDDRPESYRAWKSAFSNTIKDLDLTASEELDLISKWLGKESSAYVRRLRAVHIDNPNIALKMTWERLDEYYGAPEVIESALFKKLDNFPKITNKDNRKLRELGDLLMELLSAKEDGYLPGLAYLDTACGIKPILEKLPYNLQEKWITQGSKYKEDYKVGYPPFSFFTSFICYQAKTRNDPSFALSGSSSVMENPISRHSNFRTPVLVHKTNVFSGVIQKEVPLKGDVAKHCPIHNKPHSLKKCRGFRLKTIEERKAYMKDHGICFKCCSSTTHLARDCKVTLKCDECDSDKHIAALHPGPPHWSIKPASPVMDDGGEPENEDTMPGPVASPLCTEVCRDRFTSKSCSKICLVKVYPLEQPQQAIKMYAMIDDQSNKSLARSEFFNLFKIKADSYPYTLKTCAGLVSTSGRRANGYQIEAVNDGTSFPLPTLIECDDLPDNRDEIPTPEAAFHHPHLKSLVSEIPPMDNDAKILLLLGRDFLRVHKVRQQINSPGNAPFAQKLDLGWVLMGDVCLGKVHKPIVHNCKTNILEDGRPSLFRPCEKHIHLKQTANFSPVNGLSHSYHTAVVDHDSLGLTVFKRTADDNKRAFSIEDKQFLQIMDNEAFQDDSNSWVAPLPFKSPRPPLPNNREQAMNRLTSLQRTLEHKPKMKDQFFAFMQKIFDNNHAEAASPLSKGKECWYLPMFGVYHPRKPDQIRVVFDSSAQYNGISLNNVLLSGPDLNNSLLGVLIRFRRERIAVMADIEQMFHCFVVKEDHRDYLRFLWYRDNDPSKDIIEYRMRVHVFGNSPSPAVATYCLRRAARKGEQQYGPDTKRFVEREFYVDDGLVSTPTEEEAISLLQKTQTSLSESNLRLHKITSNSIKVLGAFPAEDHAKGIKDLCLDKDVVPTQRSLGLSWDVKSDVFTFQVTISDKPFTRRGVLSTINSLFDPLGFVAPVSIQGKSLLRELTMDGTEWDSPLPRDKAEVWETWRDSLQELQYLNIPQAYTTTCSNASRKELCVFSDASSKAISAVVYLKTTDENGQIDVGFVFGKAKLAPPTEPTIPRLELCAAVLAVEMAELIVQEIDIEVDAVTFYCDSKVVLGYIHNQSKRFYVYVHNRVQRIRQSTEPNQWKYVPTEHNPADHASRSVQASKLTKISWLTGPAFLRKPQTTIEQQETFELINPDSDVEIRPQVTSCVTSQTVNQLDPQRFTKFSSWKSLQRAVTTLIHVKDSFKKERRSTECSGWHWCPKPFTTDELSKATTAIVFAVQRASFSKELDILSKGDDIPRGSPLTKLNPIVDSKGLLRIGGRLQLSDLSDREKHPVILLGKHHVSMLLIRHYHEQVEHQGRTFTEGAIRAAGIWLVGGKCCISAVLHACVICRKLRRKREKQKMSDLPQERLSSSPPFTYTGLDVFGPWSVTARRTRGGMAQSKHWAVLFTCMSTRAVHIEVIDSLDTSSFINALRRFFAIRGPSKQLHSDCGTNFVGACRELEFHKVVTDSEVQRYANNQGCTWCFNPPHSSHMGGVWERMIGIARRILDSMLMRTPSSSLSHEVLCTLMAEVTAIINSRPLVSVSSDPDVPQILTPTMLLTQKQSVLPPPGVFTEKDLYKQQWRQVQRLADKFWYRWRHEYLHTLQLRHKWQESSPNVKKDDVVLLKDDRTCRNDWPMALVTDTFPGNDGKVRRIEVKVIKDGTAKKFLRPITEVVMLLKN